jgi:hypothetical protein
VKRKRPQRKWQDSSSNEEAGSSSEEAGSSSSEEAGGSSDAEADSSSSSEEKGGSSDEEASSSTDEEARSSSSEEGEDEENGGGSSLQAAPQTQRAQPVGAQLKALALPGIALPSDSGAVTKVGCTAMLEAQRAAEALGLPPAQFAAVCRGMQRATTDADGTLRFLAGDYPSLRYACDEGDESVAREWMERMAA